MLGEQIIIAMTIVALALIAGMTLNGIVEKLTLSRRLRHEAKSATQNQDFRDIAERTQMIEDRLRVLERIATDRGSLLSEEIEALRGSAPALTHAVRESEGAVQ